MNRETFLKQLERELRHIPAEDREDAISYYREYFEEMGVDEGLDVTQKMGSPKELARTIISEYADKYADNYAEKQNREGGGGIKNSTTAVWMVILGIFAAPIALPLAFAGGAVIFAFILVAFAIVLSLFAVSLSAAVAGICMIPAIFVAGSLAQSVVCMGLALVGAGLAIILFYGTQELYRVCVQGVTMGYRKMFSGKQVK